MDPGAFVRTGAGPGIMAAAPRGDAAGREKHAGKREKKPQRLVPGSEPPDTEESDLRTQGFHPSSPSSKRSTRASSTIRR